MIIDEWIDREILEPSNRQSVFIRIYDQKTQTTLEIPAVYVEDEDTKRWIIKPPEGTNPIAKPTHWKPHDN